MPKRSQSNYEQECAAEVIRSFELKRGRRVNWDTQWQEIAERYWPGHSRLFFQQKDSGIEGDKRNQFIFTAHPGRVLRRFAGILNWLLTPRNTLYQQFVSQDASLKKRADVVDYFDLLTKLVFQYRYAPTANFEGQNQITLASLGAYGTQAMFPDKLRDKRMKSLRYMNIHLSELWLAQDSQGRIDQFDREINYTARQILQEFGEDNCPDFIHQAAKSGNNQFFHVIHCVKPRTDVDFERMDSKGMPFASYYVLVQGGWLLEEGGYRSFPMAISRYTQMPQEVYGRSPAMDCLPSTKTLNEQKKTVLTAGHMAIRPPLLVHDDGVLDSMSYRPGTAVAGGVSANGQLLVHPLETGKVEYSKDMMDDEKETHDEFFLNDLFKVLEENPTMTATQVTELVKQKMILLAPEVGRQETEYLSPLAHRELELLSEMGVLPPPPRIVREVGAYYHTEFDTPLTRMQKAERVSGALQTVETVINIAKDTQDPSILDNLNFDKMIPDVAADKGVPPQWLNDEAKKQKIRSARQQQMAQEAQTRAAPGQAAMIKAHATAAEKAPQLAQQLQQQQGGAPTALPGQIGAA